MPPAWYLDSARVAIIEETIKKENKIQRKHLEHEVAAGRIPAYNPPSPPPPLSVLDQVGLPAFTRAAKRDPELVMGTTMSKSIWTCNPGYVLRDGARMASTTHSDYVWDDEAVEFLKQTGAFDRSYFKRRDEFVEYVEKAIKLHHNLGHRDGVGGAAGGGNGKK
ncbi:flagellar associated protein [Monoraphidium neglectum]|uniref:Flagellar associated protein n=1 Tax=Monoraphidium neglectum TaxID=145388 RepID=A0A0D2M052_9CHLO|nr:flagellar associated protein [Monoraphidium neglectum]KIY97029.1 flagellar associated protein [Monoraphidium neglectum]|eukprot:XP_013896049.1 flagellar associated protein [Monoraphidium neglectum]